MTGVQTCAFRSVIKAGIATREALARRLDGSKFRKAGAPVTWLAPEGFYPKAMPMFDSFTLAKERATALGLTYATAYLEWRTALRADFAQAFDLAAHAPVSALPFAGFLRPNGWHHREADEPIWSVS